MMDELYESLNYYRRRHQSLPAENEMNECHLVFQLPEIVSLIMQFLPNHNTSRRKCLPNNKQRLQWIYPCLFVNRLWHDCAARIMYQMANFEDATLSDFPSFAAICGTNAIADIPRPLALQHPVQRLLSDQRRNVYRRSLRSLAVRRLKDKEHVSALEKLGTHMVHLEKLEVYICDPVSNATIEPFVRSSLTELTLAGCAKVNDSLLLKVADTCPHLQHLDVRACSSVSDVSISAIARACPNLRHLNVGRVRDHDLITSRSISLVARLTRVSVVGFAGCAITDDCMLLLARLRCHDLERVSINHCPRLTNRTLRAFMYYCNRLTVFEMKECHSMNDWEAVAKLVERQVLLTLCQQQNRACAEWAKRHGRKLNVKAPIK